MPKAKVLEPDEVWTAEEWVEDGAQQARQRRSPESSSRRGVSPARSAGAAAQEPAGVLSQTAGGLEDVARGAELGRDLGLAVGRRLRNPQHKAGVQLAGLLLGAFLGPSVLKPAKKRRPTRRGGR